MDPIRIPLNLNVGCSKSGALRWQTGGPPSDVDLTGSTVVGKIWAAQSWGSPLVTLTTTLTVMGQMSIATFFNASVPSMVCWQFLPAAVAALGLQQPLDELRLEWGVDLTQPATPTLPLALIRGPVTVRP